MKKKMNMSVKSTSKKCFQFSLYGNLVFQLQLCFGVNEGFFQLLRSKTMKERRGRHPLCAGFVVLSLLLFLFTKECAGQSCTFHITPIYSNAKGQKLRSGKTCNLDTRFVLLLHRHFLSHMLHALPNLAQKSQNRGWIRGFVQMGHISGFCYCWRTAVICDPLRWRRFQRYCSAGTIFLFVTILDPNSHTFSKELPSHCFLVLLSHRYHFGLLPGELVGWLISICRCQKHPKFVSSKNTQETLATIVSPLFVNSQSEWKNMQPHRGTNKRWFYFCQSISKRNYHKRGWW